MKRTIKRFSLKLNKGKWELVLELVGAYVKQKDIFLLMLAPAQVFSRYSRHTTIRNELVKQKFVSPTGLQARAWKLSLQDAFETLDKMWLARAKKIRQKVFIRHERGLFDDKQAHYAFWILKNSSRILKLISGSTLTRPKHIEIDSGGRKKVENFLRRTISKKRGRNPRTRYTRSFALDSGMYRVFMHNGRQYISIVTLIPRKRLVIPLTGHTPISGNIRLILDFDKQRVEVHCTVDVKSKKATGKPVAIDLGITEVMTDSTGSQWGEEFGGLLHHYSDSQNILNKRRNKLYALAKKAEERGNKQKAKHIRTYNLGRKKLRKKRYQVKETLTREVKTALNKFLESKKPAIIIHEELDIRGKSKSKRLNRMINLWIRGIIKKSLSFGALVRGSVRKQVNPSYTSQMCTRCGFVHRKNRQGDAFNCRFCGQGGHSDKLAALNLLNRADDPEIARWTPPRQVKTILLNRFRRRLENWDFSVKPDEVNWAALDLIRIPATVPGRTLDTGPPTVSGLLKGNQPSIKERNCRHRNKGRLTT